jgi:cation diffusion facilitator CzcD-associated flavoprotein CzcO
MDRHGDAEASTRPSATASETIETVIIGGGQARLAVGYHLAKRNRPFVILDANQDLPVK